VILLWSDESHGYGDLAEPQVVILLWSEENHDCGFGAFGIQLGKTHVNSQRGEVDVRHEIPIMGY